MTPSVYLVGGAVRDALLNLPVRERDWVVVGATPEALLSEGYRPVGKDFPVFLHPDTREEYALARCERKVAAGYRGFTVHASPEVTLEQDLQRRDLTINAIAQDLSTGNLIDPYGGRRDLAERYLRHVSPAFVEDPVRVLRIARFSARFAPLGFRIAPETLKLMQQMVIDGELDALVADRVWAELQKALLEPKPSAFFETLRDCGALLRLFPEIDRLFEVPQSPRYHPEGDCGTHTLLVLDQSVTLSQDARIRFAALTHDLGKGLTPESLWPDHPGHEQAGLPLLDKLFQRYPIPVAYRQLAIRVMRFHGDVHKSQGLRLSALIDLLGNLEAWHDPDLQFEPTLLACIADARGRTGYETLDYEQADYLRNARRAALTVDTRALQSAGYTGVDYGRALRLLRMRAIRQWHTARGPHGAGL